MVREVQLIPGGLVGDTNMAAVTSRENTLCKICNTYLIFGQPLALAFLVHVLEAEKRPAMLKLLYLDIPLCTFV